MMLAKDNEHSIYPPLAGILLGLGAGCIWVTQGAMMMSYPTEDNKGKYIACFWSIFNLGAVLGSVFPLVMNSRPGMDPDDFSPSTYIVYMALMGSATFLAIFLVRPSSIVRDNGEPVVVAEFAGVKAEFVAILSVFCDWRMLLLIPAFFFSNFSYTYQFNDFNGFTFNIRTRSLNSIIFWVAQILGALIIGMLLDRLPMKRPRRALLGLLVVAILFNSTWIGALLMQHKYNWERRAPNSKDLIDFEHGDTYSGPLTIYAMFGFCDAAFAVYCYWLMGALSNKHEELSRYAGFFKSIQSLGSAVAAPLDLAQTPLRAYLIINWILCGFSIAAMFLVSRTITDTTVEVHGEGDVYADDEEPTEMLEANLTHAGAMANEGTGSYQQRQSVIGTSFFDENVSTICAKSEENKVICGSPTSGQRSGGWRSCNRVQSFDEREMEEGYSHGFSSSRPGPGPGSHDSYTSTATAVSNENHGKRKSSSVISASSIVDPTTCPSPTLQHPQGHIRSESRLSRAPPMVEIQDDTIYLSQQRPQPHQHLSVPLTQHSSVIPSISLTTEHASSSQSGIEPSAPATYLHPFDYLSAGTAASSASALSAAPRSSFGGASSSGSTRYDEEQDMDSVDTCSLSSLSSGHDSIPEMSDMGPVYGSSRL
ncbi:major facilitator superfamily domain-containing protein [Lobosporangium transversale]|uniref:Major facilitator superfamily domain-containing protein n=1 Tax=Lobosporangium transversale TaxID=64571 RepID=A0A1Y2GMR6_9FUNG|nr:major facilitator superfamily domain-containing protein [Lobosporangium transversale]ORZ16007.1 major facilitator superfamily domain-containing protein [Lobosporangium transversale]|eukprot:XP_021881354.1 major facilitator superfamily domain-containing protein [Lobosporangium transversale]